MKSIVNGSAIIARVICHLLAAFKSLRRSAAVVVATLSVAVACFSSGVNAQTVELRVDGENGGLPYWSPHNGPADGSDWGDKAFLYLQDALTEAEGLVTDPQGPELVEIWVAAKRAAKRGEPRTGGGGERV